MREPNNLWALRSKLFSADVLDAFQTASPPLGRKRFDSICHIQIHTVCLALHWAFLFEQNVVKLWWWVEAWAVEPDFLGLKANYALCTSISSLTKYR